jgi:replicative DNA helicase
MTFADVGALPRDPLDKLLGALDRLGRAPGHSGSGGVAHVIVAKHRNGPTGLVPLTWLPLRMRFADRSRREAS